ncbi:MAG: hypothetical protein J0I08_16305 [Rhizobiales bacterium]|nr:hypothetical protein [Hyphomicrobiales bacterium]
MKKPKNSTLPAMDAIPAKRDPQAPCGPLTCTINLGALRALSMRDLLSLRDALHLTASVAGAIRCQPRFWEEGTHNHNDAGKALDDVTEWLFNYEQAIANVAKSASPSTGDEMECRGHLLVGFEADMQDDLGDLVVIAAQAAADEATARFNDRHQIGGAA